MPAHVQATGAHPILNAIARTAARLCEARDAQIVLVEGETLRLVAQHGPLRPNRTLGEPFTLSRGTVYGRAVLERRVIQVRDLKAIARTQYPDIPGTRVRTMLAAPLLSGETVLGVIALRRLQVRPFTPKQISLLETFAAQAAIAIEKDRLSEELASRNRDLSEALDHQTATSEVLGVISASPTNVQSVFETIVSSARRLCEASFSSLNLLEDGKLMLSAVHGIDDAVLAAAREAYPQPVDRTSTSGRAILERRVIHIEDSTLDPEYTNPVRAALGLRCVLTIPLLREGQPLGAVSVWRNEVRPFTEKQIALLQTFADQAVIAIENARLFGELTEALEQQTATAEILRAISTSTMDVQPVFQAILEAGVRLIGALFGSVYRFDGTRLDMVAHHNYPSAALEFSLRTFPTPPTRQLVTGRAILERSVVHVPDVLSDPEQSSVQQFAEVAGFRSALSVPMLRDGQPIGAITLWHSAPFSDTHIALLKTFADQAIIAIENVRLFKELEARNRDLTQALEQQTATAEVLGVIGSSPTDAQPVFDAIVSSAWRLLGGFGGAVYRVVGDELHLAAFISTNPSGDAALRRSFPRPLDVFSPPGEAIRCRAPVVLIDIETAEWIPDDIRKLIRARGDRSGVWVPMLREGVALGAIGVTRSEPGGFTDEQIALLRTFAEQAVIAIENVRLFRELEARNRDLTEALEQQTATAEILRVISTSPTNLQPVLDTVVASAARFCGAYDVTLFQVEGDSLRFPAHYGPIPVPEEGAVPLVPGHVAGGAVLDRRVVHVADVHAEAAIFPEGAVYAKRYGHRTIVAAPLLREGVAIGALLLRRAEVHPFSDKQIALLQTFADQAVIAIENVRLFTELQDKNRALTLAHTQVTETLEQQTATSEVLRTIAHAQTDVQPVFETIVRNAARLCQATSSLIWLLEDDRFRVVASFNVPPDSPLEIAVADAPNLFRVIHDGMTHHIGDTESDPRMTPEALKMTRAMGVRANLAVPMRRDREAIGALAVLRSTPGMFASGQVELLKTFADQAVIAIENVRLFNELETRNRDLTEALEQQTATAEILKVISTSPTNLQPVLDTVVASAARFCGAYDANLLRIDGERLKLAAHHGPIPIAADFSLPLVRGTVAGRSVLERQALQIADLQAETAEFPEGRAYALPQGTRTLLSVPLLREGAALGAIALRRTEVNPFTDKQIALLQTFADQAVIAIENVRLFTELGQRNRELTQALEQQTATAEVLRVIGSSPTDTQPVFAAIVHSARRLLGGFSAAVFRRVGDDVHVAAYTTQSDEAPLTSIFPRPLAEFSGSGEAIRTGTIIVSTDLETDPRMPEVMRAAARVRAFRSAVWVPMLKEGTAIGAIGVTRNEPGGFADEQIALLKTFADQAVIAIENVRLFTELEARNRDLTEALEQQTATAEILRVISSSPTSVEAVFDTILENALRLCDTPTGGIFTFDGEAFHIAAAAHWNDEFLAALREAPILPGPETPLRRVGLELRPSQVADIFSDPSFSPPEMYRREGMRTALAVPMLKEGRLIGALTFHRHEVRPFTTKQIALIETFADQAVIAIENVRLFKELEVRNHDLTEALEQQTATSEILRVISQSQTDVQPVFDTIVQSAVELCDAVMGNLQQFDGERMHLVATHNIPPEALKLALSQYPMRLDKSRAANRAVLNRAVVNIPDVFHDPDYGSNAARVAGWRSVLSVPMLREGKSVGAITVARAAAGMFSENHVELLKTFADQAVIAVENVRLFKELQARTTELTQSVEQLTALGEVSRAVTSTLDVETVLDTVVSRARQLAGADGCLIYEYDEGSQQFHSRATDNLGAAYAEALRAAPLRKGEGVSGRAAEVGEAVQVPDIIQPSAYQSGVRDITIQAGYRAVLSVPLLREDEIIGSLILIRKTPGEFSPEIVELLKTFATQSALAIQNARLFREIEDKGRELELASKHKSQFLANMSHELRTPLNAILGYTELLLDGIYGEVSEKARETMGRIERSGRHLLALINDVLDLSKIEAGQLTLSLADYSLAEIVNTVVTAMEPLAAEKGLALRVALDPGLPVARGDDRRLSQVLLNLVGNAVKFTDAGEVRIAGKVSDGAFVVSVSDTGPGIAAEDQARIFDEFQQVDASNTRKKGGTGLGLSIARRILAMHGGRIWVESAPGQGATFSFTLPVRVERMVQA